MMLDRPVFQSCVATRRNVTMSCADEAELLYSAVRHRPSLQIPLLIANAPLSHLTLPVPLPVLRSYTSLY
jgi:hypothetical protein